MQGFGEYFRDDAVCLVEWPEKAVGYLPPADLVIRFRLPKSGDGSTVVACSEEGQKCLKALRSGCRTPPADQVDRCLAAADGQSAVAGGPERNDGRSCGSHLAGSRLHAGGHRTLRAPEIHALPGQGSRATGGRPRRIEFNNVLESLANKVAPDDPNIRLLRAGRYKPGVVRLVMELKGEVNPQVFVLPPVGDYGHRLVLDVYPLEPA
jgi:hypothetical protein